MIKNLEAIDTHYDGHHFRSRLEAKWAVFFNAMGWKWGYETEGYKLPSGKCYLPDFHLTELDIYIEVKPKELTKDELDLCLELSNFIVTPKYGIDIILCEGDPSSRPFRTVVNGNVFVPVILMHRDSMFYPFYQSDERNTRVHDLEMTKQAAIKATSARFEREWKEKGDENG